MPLDLGECSNLYSDHIQSNDVIDEIVYGAKEYPVVDLCRMRKFDYAFILLQKGYRCLHEDVIHETMIILRATQRLNHLKTSGRDKIPDILNKLSEELNYINPTVLRSLVQTYRRELLQKEHYASLMKFIPLFRNNQPLSYDTCLQLDDWTVSDLMKLDIQFWEDYVEKLTTENRLEKFIDSNKLNQQEAVIFLPKLLDVNYLKLLDSQEKILYRIASDCTGIFPENFTCDVAILASVGKLRMIVNALEEFEPGPDTEVFSVNRNYQALISQLYHLLPFHMKETFSFDRVAQTLITSCGINGTECDLEPTEIPQLCDYYILDAVSHFARQHFHIDKLPISEDTLKTATADWMDMHNTVDWKDYYELAMPKINELVGWFYDNCDIKK